MMEQWLLSECSEQNSCVKKIEEIQVICILRHVKKVLRIESDVHIVEDYRHAQAAYIALVVDEVA